MIGKKHVLGAVLGFAMGLAGGAVDTGRAWAQEVEQSELTARETIDEGNRALVILHGQGRYAEALDWAEKLHMFAEDVLSGDDPLFLTVLNNFAALYKSQGRYGEAEPLYKQALKQSRTVLGDEHPDTLVSLNNLASLYESQGRYGEAEPLYKQALKQSRTVLGDEHPQTLVNLNNLAGLYSSQGRYGEAEPLYMQALKQSRTVLGDEHPQTLGSLNNLAALYFKQGRYGKAEPLYRQSLELRRTVLGDEHPDTLGSLSNLAFLYSSQGRYGEAEPLYKQALERSRTVLGDEHPRTLGSLNSLGFLYSSQGRYEEAEPLYRQSLELRRTVLGDEHPDTLGSLSNLAFLYSRQGRYVEAETLYKQALERSRTVLGDEHPRTLTTARNLVALLIETNRPEMAASRLERIGERMLRWTGAQLATIRQVSTKRLLLRRQSSFQDVSIGLAVSHPSERTRRLAANTMLAWKQLASDEDAYLARLLRTTDDSAVVAVGTRILAGRTDLAEAFHQDNGTLTESLLAKLEEDEAELARISRDFREHRTKRPPTSRVIERALPEGSALIEYRLYQPFDYVDGRFEAPRWAAVLLRPYEEPLFADLAPMQEPPLLNEAMTKGDDAQTVQEASARLYDTLFGAFDDALAEVETLYVAPDGALNLIPFAQLRTPDGRYLIEHHNLRFVHSGRALVDSRERTLNRGLVAFGGIDFETAEDDGIVPASLKTPGAIKSALLGGDGERAIDLARGSLSGTQFAALPASRSEVDDIATLYGEERGEPVQIWKDASAHERRIKALSRSPRVAHFATHGFYLNGESEAAKPLLLSGLAFSGANEGIQGRMDSHGDDGILFAIEASGLNLHNTELVVMSACDTAQGDIDYSEGVYGLGRAFRIAGAQNTLMTLWALNDNRAKDFMIDFYTNWLNIADRDPAEALTQTKRAWAGSSDPMRADPKAWAPYMLIQSGR